MFHNNKQISKQLLIIISLIIISFLVGCGAQEEKRSQAIEDEGIIVGFSQIGAESAWRTCNTRSVQEAAAERGVQLVYDNAEQKTGEPDKGIAIFYCISG